MLAAPALPKSPLNIGEPYTIKVRFCTCTILQANSPPLQPSKNTAVILKQTSLTLMLLHALQALTLDPSKQQTATSNKTALHLFYTNPQNWANAQVNTPLGHAEPEA
jgi:hypothetical protein